MRILSKFQDYYDKSLAHGFENDRVYVRQNQVWSLKDGSEKNPEPCLKVLEELFKKLESAPSISITNSTYDKTIKKNKPKNRSLHLVPFEVIVGGEIHKGVWIQDVELNQFISDDRYGVLPRGNPNDERLADSLENSLNWGFLEKKNKVIIDHPEYSVDALKKVLNENGWSDEILNKVSSWSWRDSAYKSYSTLINWLETPSPALYGQLTTEKLVTGIVTKSFVVKDPSLKDWQFFRKLDPVSCMQEIAMFVGNMASPDNTPVTISDKDRIAQHGFDNQSFRKSSTKHGTPPRAKRPHPDRPADDMTP